MATNMRFTYTTRPVEDYLDDFAGREDMAGYDAEKPIKIAEENRDFVWKKFPELWIGLIVSILTGFPIPQMVVCDNLIMDGGNRSTVLMKWRRNEFEVTVGDWTGKYESMTPTLIAKWNRCVVPMTVITNATPQERSDIYEKYNQGVPMSFGCLLWNRSYQPLVQMARAMIGWGGGDFPFADLIHQVWRSTWRKNDSMNCLAFAYQILAASSFGKDYFHGRFSEHVRDTLQTPAEEIDLSNLHFICMTLQSVDPDRRVNPKIKEQFFKNFIGAMIFDIHSPDLTRVEFEEKWCAFGQRAYTVMTKDDMKRVVDVGTARATNDSRIQRLSKNVAEYLTNTLEARVVSPREEEEEEEEESDE